MEPSTHPLSRRAFVAAVGTAGASAAVGSAGTTTGTTSDGPTPEWTVSPPDAGHFRPTALTGGTAYATVSFTRSNESDAHGALYAVDAGTGDVTWSYDLQSAALPPTVVDGTLYVSIRTEPANGADSGWRLVALDADGGDELWRKPGDSSGFPVPAVEDGTVFSSRRSGVVAVDAESGEQQWAFEPGDDEFGRPVVAGESVYVTANGGVYAVSTGDGTRQWHRDPRDGTRSYVVLADDEYAYCVDERRLFALDAADGTTAWTTPVSGISQPLLDGTTLYLWGNSSLHAVDTRDGTKRWTYDGASLEGVTPVVADGTLFAGTYAGTLHAVNADEGSKRWTFDAGGRTGIRSNWGGVRGGVAYVAGDDGLYALSAADGTVEWSFEGDADPVSAVVGERRVVFGTGDALHGFERSRPFLATAVEDATTFLTSGSGLVLSGTLVGTAAFAAYRRLNGEDEEGDEREVPTTDDDAAPEPEYGRLERLDAGAFTETYRVRKRTDDGPRVVVRKRLTEPDLTGTFRAAVERWADLGDRPGVVPVLDRGDDWVELPDYDGTLADWDRSFDERVDALSAANATVHRAHRDGLVHGGLAPGAVLLHDDATHVGD